MSDMTLKMILFNFIYLPVTVIISFFNDWAIFYCIMYCIIFIYSSFEGHRSSFQFLTFMNKQQWTWLNKFFCGGMKHLWGICPGVVYLDIEVGLFPCSRGTTKLISIVTVQVYPLTCTRHPGTHELLLVLLSLVILRRVRKKILK